MRFHSKERSESRPWNNSLRTKKKAPSIAPGRRSENRAASTTEGPKITITSGRQETPAY